MRTFRFPKMVAGKTYPSKPPEPMTLLEFWTQKHAKNRMRTRDHEIERKRDKATQEEIDLDPLLRQCILGNS